MRSLINSSVHWRTRSQINAALTKTSEIIFFCFLSFLTLKTSLVFTGYSEKNANESYWSNIALQNQSNKKGITSLLKYIIRSGQTSTSVFMKIWIKLLIFTILLWIFLIRPPDLNGLSVQCYDSQYIYLWKTFCSVTSAVYDVLYVWFWGWRS